MAKRGPKGPMTDEHKAALAMGRNEGNAVRNYLEALRSNKPKRGRRRTRESIAARLSAIDAELETADPMNELRLRQERRDLQAEMASLGAKVDISALENGLRRRRQVVQRPPGHFLRHVARDRRRCRGVEASRHRPLRLTLRRSPGELQLVQCVEHRSTVAQRTLQIECLVEQLRRRRLHGRSASSNSRNDRLSRHARAALSCTMR